MPNIVTALKIEVEKYNKHYRADAKVLPGSPPVGIGKTKYAALYNLCVNLLYIVANDEDGSNNAGYKSIILKILKEDYGKTY